MTSFFFLLVVTNWMPSTLAGAHEAVLTHQAATATATVSAPSSAKGGKPVTVTGTSPSGESTTLSILHDGGSIEPDSVVWVGDAFTLIFTMPKFDPSNEENEVSVTATPEAPNHSGIAYISVRP